MTRKHFVAVADAISKEVKASECEATLAALDSVAAALCTVFQKDNPAFDRDRFLTACGLVN